MAKFAPVYPIQLAVNTPSAPLKSWPPAWEAARQKFQKVRRAAQRRPWLVQNAPASSVTPAGILLVPGDALKPAIRHIIFLKKLLLANWSSLTTQFILTTESIYQRDREKDERHAGYQTKITFYPPCSLRLLILSPWPCYLLQVFLPSRFPTCG